MCHVTSPLNLSLSIEVKCLVPIAARARSPGLTSDRSVSDFQVEKVSNGPDSGKWIKFWT